MIAAWPSVLLIRSTLNAHWKITTTKRMNNTPMNTDRPREELADDGEEVADRHRRC
jgi:hypothetical protein